MRGDHISIFLIISMVTAPFNGAAPSNCPNSSTWQLNNRRILHQPLFPIDSPPPPPPPPIPDIPEGQPFSNELPAGPTFDESYQPPPPPLPEMGTAVATSTAANPHAMKKLVIAALSTAVTVGMLLAMAFFLYKNRGKRHDESQKLVDENSQRIDEERRVPPPPFLCIEAAEPSTSGLVDEEAHINIVSSSPYQKLKPKPRPKPPPPPRMSSPPPPPMSSSGSDDETRNHNESDNLGSRPIPHSKRTPPKSRFSTSSPDTRPSTPHSTKPLPFPPSRTKFSASPPSPATGQLLSMSSYEHKPSKIPIPPPPPPPPSMATKHGAAKKYTPVFKQKRRGQSKSPSPKASPSSNRTRPVNKGLLQSPEESRPRMKPLHWDKVGATADGATVWDHLKSTSFQLNEGAMESLFGCNSVASVPRETTRKFVLPSVQLENRILDSKKSQNIAILLRALNVTREEVSEALLDGNPEGLGPELFETLVKMAPSKEEEKKLREYNDDISRLGPAERFLKAILDIPFAFKRVEALLYKENFNTEVKYLRKSFQTLEEASEELKNSRLFLKLLEAVLRTGNHMNGGTNRGDAKAFKLDTLLKLVDIKGKDGKTTLLHFVVQEVIRSEGAGYTSESQSQKSNSKFNEEDFKKEGLQVVAGLSKELGNVKKAAGMDSDVLSSYVSKLELGLQTVRQVLQFENHISQDKFVDSIKVFLEEAVDEISRIKAEERKALSLVKEVTQYFHGDDAKREAHPLRIFTVIRDFLSILDNVCKDVGRMQERSTMGSGRSFRLPAAMALPVLTRYNTHNDRSSDDDSM